MKTPGRIQLESLLKQNKDYLKGLTLNVAGGSKTYRHLIQKMINIDLYGINPSGNKINLDVRADITKTFPFKSESFDSVICTQVLEHVAEPKKVIEEIFRVLKKSGNLVLSVPFLYKYHADPKDFWRFSKDGVRELLKDSFKIIKLIPIGGRYFWFLTFLQTNHWPDFIIKILYPFCSILTKNEKHREKWALDFFVIAIKK